MYRKLVLSLVLAPAVAALLLSCAPKGEKAGEAKKAGGSPVLAVVNGDEISADDFKEEASSLSPFAASALTDEKNKEKFLENLIDKQLIVQKAREGGLDKDPELVRRFERIKSSLLLGTFVKKEILDKVKLTDADVKTYFDAHKDELGAVRISHILVGSREEAEEVLARIEAGDDFPKLAKKYSLDTKTKQSGGDLGYVKWEQFGSPGLKDAAFKLKPGEVSGIVQSQFGFHIMKVTDKKPASDADFEKMKDALGEQATEKKKEELFDSLVKQMREKAHITRNPDNIKSVTLESPAQAPAQKQ